LPCPSSLIPAGDGSVKFNGLSLIPWNDCGNPLCDNYEVENLVLNLVVHVTLNTQESSNDNGNGNGGNGNGGNGGNRDVNKSFWEKYRWWIIGGIIALVVLIIIIILIVILTRKK
jgi:hypothetical protein